jgi:2-methylisocitrate lyase-like PEP mutase family enzyme
MEKAEAFRALHARPGAFIIPNPWDAGTAKLLAAMGFEALATTSLGLANTLGSLTVSLDAIIENCRMIADATDLPVNADLENCGADDPKTAAKAIARAAEAGCVGGSIEDSTGDPGKPIYDFLRDKFRLRTHPLIDKLSVEGNRGAYSRARNDFLELG